MNNINQIINRLAKKLKGDRIGDGFNDYVLGAIVYRCLSEKLKIEQSDLFSESSKRPATAERLKTAFQNIEKVAQLEGVFDSFNVDSEIIGKTAEEREAWLHTLLDGVAEMGLDLDSDCLGHAYECLKALHKLNTGGEFYTPTEVAELVARIGSVGKEKVQNVYDPTCGSGALLLAAEKTIGKGASFFGQELNPTTSKLCKVNLRIRNLNFDIACGDTLTNPKHWDSEPFDLIVANPPYSVPWEGDKSPQLKEDKRFSPAGVLAPKSKADFAFIMHCLSYLSENGTAAIVETPGILYRSGAEQKIRKYLVDNNFIDCVIQLPPKLFLSTAIATCIVVLKKGKPDNRVLFIDATNECVKGNDYNKLTKENTTRIVDAFTQREELAHFSHLVSYDEITKSNYDLSISAYVETKSYRKKIDIVQLEAEIEKIIAAQNAKRKALEELIKEIKGINL